MEPPDAVKVVEEPIHMGFVPALTVIVGNGFNVAVTVAVFAQPFEFVPVMVYVVATVGVAVTIEPVVADRSADGDQV